MSHQETRNRRTSPGVLIMIAVVIAALVGLLLHEPPTKPTETRQAPVTKPLESVTTASDTDVPDLTERVRSVIDSNGPARAETLRSIGDDLTDDESRALLGTLLKPRDPSVPEGTHSVDFHETALLLQRQENIRHNFARTLVTVARDDSRDAVIRDYAVQHLCQLWRNSSPDLAAAIKASLLEITDKTPVLAPSALLALHLLDSPSASAARTQVPGIPAISNDEIAPRVHALLARKDSATTTAARMTALRIIGERRLDGFHDDLARIASDPAESHALVRMSAIAAISRFDDPGDLSLLRSLDRSDSRLAAAIDHAISRLESQP